MEVQMKVDINRNDPFAFVTFESPADAAHARNALHRTPGLGSNSLIVDFKRSNAVWSYCLEYSFLHVISLLFHSFQIRLPPIRTHLSSQFTLDCSST